MINKSVTVRIKVPDCKIVFLPNFTNKKIEKIAPRSVRKFKIMGAMGLNPGIVYFTIFPPYATTTFIPISCLKVFKWRDANMGTGAVAGSGL